jgi:hypothetical protein
MPTGMGSSTASRTPTAPGTSPYLNGPRAGPVLAENGPASPPLPRSLVQSISLSNIAPA